MNVAFYTVLRGDPSHLVLAEILTGSVRKAMPGATVVQLTDRTTPAVPGVDVVRRRDSGPMSVRRIEHYWALGGETLFVDTDVIIERCVEHVFGEPFDVAVADRKGWMNVAAPFNFGVMFSRSRRFWEAVLLRLQAMPAAEQEWMGEQTAAHEVVRAGGFDVKVLPGLLYNHPPKSAIQDLGGKYILHYKGARKALMLERAGEYRRSEWRTRT